MSRPDFCPNCACSVTAHTGAYCHNCGAPLVASARIRRLRPSRAELEDMAAAHAEGLHNPDDGLPREFCPECERAGWVRRY